MAVYIRQPNEIYYVVGLWTFGNCVKPSIYLIFNKKLRDWRILLKRTLRYLVMILQELLLTFKRLGKDFNFPKFSR